MDRLRRLVERSELIDRTLAQLDKEVSAHNKLKRAVKAIATRNGTCWCGVKSGVLEFEGEQLLMHTAVCDDLFLVLYGAERGE